MSSINIPGKGQITYDEYHWNSPKQITLPGGCTKSYTYDPLMQVKSIISKDPTQTDIISRSYQYSPEGNIDEKATEHGVYTYGYDDVYRLTSATNPTINDEAYTYDDMGNRLTSESGTITWNYNQNNELEGYNGVTYQYDDNGNTTQITAGALTDTYIYDEGDRLISVEEGGENIADYYYDPFGRRLWKEVDGIRTYFLYSDEGLIAEYDSTGQEIKTYGYILGSQWTTDPLYQKIGGTYYWYHNDHLGTPQKITNSSGAVVWEATYDSFGYAQIGIETITNNLRFPGQYYDEETGLHYNWNRYYDPSTGRYLRTDPAFDGLNLYVYVNSNPLIGFDPQGLTSLYSNSSVGSYDYNQPIDLSLDLDLSAYFHEQQEANRASWGFDSISQLPISSEDQTSYQVPTIRPVYYKNNLTGESVYLGYNSAETLKRLELLQSYNVAEQIGDCASYTALGLNVANLGATVTGNIPAAETLGVAAAVADTVALASYAVSGNQQKAVYAAISVGVDLVPAAAVELKPAYNPVAKRFIHAGTKRFITNKVGMIKYAVYPATNAAVGGIAPILPGLEKEVSKYLDN